MNSYLENLTFTANVIAPVFLIILLGIILKKVGLINEQFVTVSSKIVFNIALPVLVFLNISKMDMDKTFDLLQIIYIYAVTIFVFIISWIVASIFIDDRKKQGVFVQGAFRSNFAIIGFAIIFNMFGEVGLGKAAIILAFIMPLYNVLSVVVLTITTHSEKEFHWMKILIEIIKNPLIIAVVLAIPFSLYQITLHSVIVKTGNYISALTLPLALIGIGGGLNFSSIKVSPKYAFGSSSMKILFIPLIFTSIAFALGFEGQDLGIMYVIFAAPTAIVSFIMAKAMNADSELAANIVVITTLGSMITMSLGVFILKSMDIF